METSDRLTVREAAELLRLSAASVYSLCSQRKIQFARVGPGRGKIVITLTALEQYLTGGEVGVAPTPPPVPARVRPKPLHVRMKP